VAGTSRSRIDQQSKGPFNGFEDRACHRAKLAPTRSLSTLLLVEDEEEYRKGQTGERINQERKYRHRRDQTLRHIQDR
jgi:hypothetical protein